MRETPRRPLDESIPYDLFLASAPDDSTHDGRLPEPAILDEDNNDQAVAPAILEAHSILDYGISDNNLAKYRVLDGEVFDYRILAEESKAKESKAPDQSSILHHLPCEMFDQVITFSILRRFLDLSLRRNSPPPGITQASRFLRDAYMQMARYYPPVKTLEYELKGRSGRSTRGSGCI